MSTSLPHVQSVRGLHGGYTAWRCSDCGQVSRAPAAYECHGCGHRWMCEACAWLHLDAHHAEAAS